MTVYRMISAEKASLRTGQAIGLAAGAAQGQAQGLLLYPRAPEQEDVADAEAHGPWQTESKAKLRFTRLAIHPQDAVIELRDLLGL